MRRPLLLALAALGTALTMSGPAAIAGGHTCAPPVDQDCWYYPPNKTIHCIVFVAYGGFEFCANTD